MKTCSCGPGCCVDDVLDEIYDLTDASIQRRALFRWVRHTLNEEHYETVNCVLQAIDREKVDPELLVSLLRCTFAARDKLQAWELLLGRARDANGPDADRLLAGLEES